MAHRADALFEAGGKLSKSDIPHSPQYRQFDGGRRNTVRFLTRCSAILFAATLLATMTAAQQPAPTSAVVPRWVNFSGKLTDASGKPSAAAAGATFAIYRDQEGGLRCGSKPRT
jgi:hypothetical protein